MICGSVDVDDVDDVDVSVSLKLHHDNTRAEILDSPTNKSMTE
mgnify:FL=1